MIVAISIYAATTWPDVAMEFVRGIPVAVPAIGAFLVGLLNRRDIAETKRIAHETNTVVNDRVHGAPTMSQDVKELKDRSDKGEVRRDAGLPPEGGEYRGQEEV